MTLKSLDFIEVGGLPRGSFVHRIQATDNNRPNAAVDFSHFDGTRQAVCITEATLDEPGPILEYVNQSYLEIFCLERDDVIGVSPRFGQGPLTSRVVLDRLRSHLENRQSIRAQAINYRADGSPFHLRWTIDSLDLADGSQKFIAMLDDVTMEHRLRQRLVALDLMVSASRRVGELDGVDRTRAVASMLEAASAALLIDIGQAAVELGESAPLGEDSVSGQHVEVDPVPVSRFGRIRLEVHADAVSLVDHEAFARIADHAAWLLGLGSTGPST